MLQVTKQLSKKKLERRASLKVTRSYSAAIKVTTWQTIKCGCAHSCGESGRGDFSASQTQPALVVSGKSSMVSQACNREQRQRHHMGPGLCCCASQQHCLAAVPQLLAWELQLVSAGAPQLLRSPALWERLPCAGRQLKECAVRHAQPCPAKVHLRRLSLRAVACPFFAAVLCRSSRQQTDAPICIAAHATHTERGVEAWLCCRGA